MPGLTEQQLVNKAVLGDRGALGRLLEAYQHRLYNVVLRMVCNRDDALDVTQETMLKIVSNIEGFGGRSALGTWMVRIAMNEAISFLRRRRDRGEVSLDGEMDGRSDGEQASSLKEQIRGPREQEPVERVQKNEMLKLLHLALGLVEADLRAVLVLRDIDDMEYDQIAEVLEIPLGTVKSRLFRARLALRRQMYLFAAGDDKTRAGRRESLAPGGAMRRPQASVDPGKRGGAQT